LGPADATKLSSEDPFLLAYVVSDWKNPFVHPWTAISDNNEIRLDISAMELLKISSDSRLTKSQQNLIFERINYLIRAGTVTTIDKEVDLILTLNALSVQKAALERLRNAALHPADLYWAMKRIVKTVNSRKDTSGFGQYVVDTVLTTMFEQEDSLIMNDRDGLQLVANHAVDSQTREDAKQLMSVLTKERNKRLGGIALITLSIATAVFMIIRSKRKKADASLRIIMGLGAF
jgi:hypothetical protein